MIKLRTSFGMPSSVTRGRGRILLASSLALSTWLATTPAYSAGLSFLKEAPVRFFNEEDWRLFKRAVKSTLEKQPDGEISSWKNPATGSEGALKALKTYRANGTTCRTVETYNKAAGRAGQSVFDYCKQADGTWKLDQ